MRTHSESAENAPASASGPGGRRPRAAHDHSALPPMLPLAGRRIAVLCRAEDVEYAESELVAPLVLAGFRVALGPIPPGQPPELPDRACHLVLLDIAPKDPLGYAVCAELRDRLGLPLMLVLRGAASDDLLRGYEAGADSCLLAPFDVREFLARLAALLRRQTPFPPSDSSAE